MLLKITKCADKSKDWKVVSYETPEGGVTEEASINRTDKKGVVFPDFDGIMEGRTIDGNPWRNPSSGKWSIYPPKPESTGTTVRSGGGIKANMEKVMDKKQENIRESQEHKDLSIKISSTMNKAVELAIAEYESNKFNIQDGGTLPQYPLDELVIKWRHWLWQQWDKTNPDDIAPF